MVDLREALAELHGIDLGAHYGGGYVPFWIDVPMKWAKSTREVLVLVDNRFNQTTAPVHTGGDFYMGLRL